MCDLAHIPSRLHQNDRQPIQEFFYEEEIYRRSKPEDLEFPFAKIKLADVSVNRQGNPDKPLCMPEDVMYNTKDNEGENVPIYKDDRYVILKVKELLPDSTYKRVFTENGNTLELLLKHDPIPCNYSHSVFELILNGKIVLFTEYKETFGKRGLKELRDKCRDELQKMIFRRELVLKDFQ